MPHKDPEAKRAVSSYRTDAERLAAIEQTHREAAVPDEVAIRKLAADATRAYWQNREQEIREEEIRNSTYARRYWKNNPKMRADQAVKEQTRFDELRRWYREFKKNRGCSRCPERHPSCLTFHHLGDKDMDVSRLVEDGRSKEGILAEIAKCIVLCANCHAKEHWQEQ